MRTSLLAAVVASAFAAAAGCSREAAEDADGASLPVTAAELGEAKAVTALVKARCAACHTAGKAEIRRWGQAMQAIERDCLSPSLALEPAARVACLRSDPADPSSGFSESKLGFFALATTHAPLRDLFTAAGGAALHAQLTAEASMPPLGTTAPRFDEAEVAALKKWVLGGMIGLDEAMAESGAPCVASTSPALASHLAEMKAAGWAARLADASVPMYGCAAGASPLACLAAHPEITAAWGAPAVPQTLRRLHELPFSTYAWTRSSADGRFAAYGGKPARIVDLGAPGGSPRAIRVAAEFDPAFLPDNTGFSYANRSGSRVHVCRQSVLLAATALADPSITLTEPGCSTMTSADYQAIGASLDGSLFLMASGTHENDVTFSLTHGPLSGSFGAAATTNVLPMLSDGAGWTERARITLAHPFEGDGGLSPSTRLLYTRFGTTAGQRGYRIRKLTMRGAVSPAPGEPALSLETEQVATICSSGAKVMSSFDERFLVTHQYVDPAEGTGMPKDSANVLLFDLLTGESIRLTQLARGQYAFSPHFRADGWIYFLVRDANTRQETLVASDAAVRRALAR